MTAFAIPLLWLLFDPQIQWDPRQSAVVGGDHSIRLTSGTILAGDLEVGLNAGDNSRVEVDGAQLVLMQDSLRVGEYTGSRGEFTLKQGAMHCVMDVFAGAATSAARRANHATLRISGGSFLGRSISAGLGFGAETLVSIGSSKPSAVDVLDYVYLEGHSGGNTTLAFALDSRGVTPITIRSHRDGLRVNQDAGSHVRLRISLTAIPPREDITLVAAHVPSHGTFDDLPEGSEINAQFVGRTFHWLLTYRGGKSGCDLVLRNHSEYLPNDPVTHVREIPEPPKPLWREHSLYPINAQTGEPAFEGAEGFGAFTPGGRGGRIVYVENLNDSGQGSLREAIRATGPRIIRFRVSGDIPLNSKLTITEPFLTIEGQSAPSDGITLRNHGIVVETHDVILRYLRVRVGAGDGHADDKSRRYEAGEGEDGLYFSGAENCIADHLSLSWTTSKILTTTKMSDRITVQWCILSEALNFAGHGFASITGGNRVTWHHNLLAHNVSRNVRFQGPVDVDFRNNVIYDWGHTAAYGEFDRVNYIGNYLKAGPSTTQRPRLFHSGDAYVFPEALFVAGNVMEGEASVNQDNWLGMGYDRAGTAAPGPFAAPAVTTETAQTAFEHVLSSAGATLPKRDAVDARVVRETREGTGHIINWVRDLSQ
jgi:hypothetical protein